MKVLLVSPNFFPKLGGVESHIAEILRNVKDVEFTVLTNWREGAEAAAERFPGVDFVYGWPADKNLRKMFSWSGPTFRGFRVVSSVLEVLRTMNRVGWLSRLSPDIVHVHYLQLDQTDRLARHAALGQWIHHWYRWVSDEAKRRAPVLFTDHTVFSASPEIVPNEAKQALLAAFENVISVDRESFEIVRAHQVEHGGRAWFIPNSVDTDVFREGAGSHQGFHVGYAGRMDKAGQAILEQVVREIGEDVVWHFAISGEQADYRASMFANMGNRARCFLNLDYHSMPAFYQSIDLLFNPFPGAGVGRTTLEAMACGVPVIAVGVGDKYPIRDNLTGFLIPANPRAIAKRILELSTDGARLRQMGKACREVAFREYSNHVLLPRLRTVYGSLV